jgi:hypothetical protein
MMCAGAWNAEHTRKRKWGKLIIRAMNGYLKEGGRWTDLDKFRFYTNRLGGGRINILAGYDGDTAGVDVPDITSELLADLLQIAHPDHHPPERHELANRVTKELLELRPYVFPKPAPPPKPIYSPPPDNASPKVREKVSESRDKPFPCELCSESPPSHYCDTCKAEEARRAREKHEKQKAKQRAWYARRRERAAWSRVPITCGGCGKEFNCGAESSDQKRRRDSKYCSSACRQKAHRKRVTDGLNPRRRDLERRNGQSAKETDVVAAIAALFTGSPDDSFDTIELIDRVFPGLNRVEKKHRTAVVSAAKQLCDARDWSWFIASHRGGTFVFFNRRSVTSYAMGRLKADYLWWRTRRTPAARAADNEHLRAKLLPGGDNHEYVVEGGSWWRHVQLDIADLDGDDSARIKALRTKQKEALASVWGAAP